MVLRLDCPHCGARPLEEWVYGSTTDTHRTISGRDMDHSFMVGNVEGVTEEGWFHAGGCRRWQTITRDTTLDRSGRAPQPRRRPVG